MFLHLSVILFIPPGRHPPGKHPLADPLGQRSPTGQTAFWEDTPRADTPLGRQPPGETPLWTDTPLRSVCWDTVNKWAVRILLECILVQDVITKYFAFYQFFNRDIISVERNILGTFYLHSFVGSSNCSAQISI